MALVFILLFSTGTAAGEEQWPVYRENPFVIPLDSSQHSASRRGGVIVADLDGDGLLDYIVSKQENDFGAGATTLGAYGHFGALLWIKSVQMPLNGKAETDGLPGLAGPGVSAADIDGDGRAEVIHLGVGNEIVVRDGSDGEVIKILSVSPPGESWLARAKFTYDTYRKGDGWRMAIETFRRTPERWAHFQIVNLRGAGDDEIILQADPLPFRWLKAVSLDSGKTLWENFRYVGLKHGGFRAADIDGDGFDEVVGATVIDQGGTAINPWDYRYFPGHFDSLAIGDIRPDTPGLEWVLLEEGKREDDQIALLGGEEIFFYRNRNGQEPQNVAVGEFDNSKPGLEIWIRSHFDKDQQPWVLDSRGETIAAYRLNDTKPPDWSDSGIEFIAPIDWDGGGRQLLAAKERHQDGRICLLDPLTGEFVRWWPENASRIYVVDVAGDYREEIVVINSGQNEIRVYWNDSASLGAPRERRWEENSYRRLKLNYNYYSP